MPIHSYRNLVLPNLLPRVSSVVPRTLRGCWRTRETRATAPTERSTVEQVIGWEFGRGRPLDPAPAT